MPYLCQLQVIKQTVLPSNKQASEAFELMRVDKVILDKPFIYKNKYI
jgi:hypothetical protein